VRRAGASTDEDGTSAECGVVEADGTSAERGVVEAGERTEPLGAGAGDDGRGGGGRAGAAGDGSMGGSGGGGRSGCACTIAPQNVAAQHNVERTTMPAWRIRKASLVHRFS
jgi:hypothetical protein